MLTHFSDSTPAHSSGADVPPSEPGEELSLPDPVAEEAPVEEPPVEEPPCVATRGDPPRVADRDEPVDDDETDDPADDEELDEPDDDELTPVEPAEPVVSAKATAGIDAIAAPTPKSDRQCTHPPTKREEPDPSNFRHRRTAISRSRSIH